MGQISYDYGPSGNNAAMVLDKRLLLFHCCVSLLKMKHAGISQQRSFSTGREKKARVWKFPLNSVGVPVMESYFISHFPAMGPRSRSEEHTSLKQMGRSAHKPPHEGTQLFFLLFQYDGTKSGPLAADAQSDRDWKRGLWSLERLFGENPDLFPSTLMGRSRQYELIVLQ